MSNQLSNNISPPSKEEIKKEIENNLKVFQEKLPEILEKHNNGYVLLKAGKVKGVYSTLSDVRQASSLIEDGLYSIQEIIQSSINLGYYSHAVF